MPLDIEVIAKLLSPLIAALIGAIAKRYFEGKPKLISYLVHSSAIPLNDDKNTQVNTHCIVVRNAGKKTAHNIRVGHNFLPKGFQIYPPVSYTVLESSNGSAEILIPTLVPSEQVSISYLYFPPLTWSQVNAYTKSDEGMANIINAIPTPQPSKFVVLLIGLLMFLGASTLVYWLFLFAARLVTQSA
ncbi:hypothetical protein SCT_2070 [Sulfuricella sp. T08]|uniref:hypothetical protein n=1 Tax=Sulfuricella sp. T08 TaxID=1632857 RepID=UPI0006179A7B|nr:hypothetical protein [Sulfuricella sp. T08]GAO36660.1 hypothetical protein SCT_2070 [Sulfuricella sp. T08]